jgi:peptidoglycan/LPS O-acetylase OafA/YrhL
MDSSLVDVTGTKKHFIILDGLRGTAALAVVIFHFMEWVFSDFTKNFISHGYLAVDFFFCLSGFVIAYAYDDRMQKIGMIEFFKARLIRLHPLVILGSVLGLLAFFLDPYSTEANVYETSIVILLFVSSLLLVPAPMMEGRAFNLFGLNAPSWSLFWEYVANIFYAFILSKINRIILIVLLVIAAATLAAVAYRAGNLLGGWAGNNFWDGGARVFYSFLAGILIFRCNLIIQNKFGFISLSVLLLLAFVMPTAKWSWFTELLVVLIYFPLIVALGAGSTISPRLKKLCEFSGDISYPLYMTHYWAIWIFGHYYTSVKPPMKDLVFVITGGVIFLILFAYLAMRFFDIPVRRYLNHKRELAQKPESNR